MRTEKFRSYFKKPDSRADSRFEGNVADELERQKQNKEILDYDKQFTIAIYSPLNNKLLARHKVDFRVYHVDASFELIEAKGFETMDYIIRRNLLEHIWLPQHPDYTYTVIKQGRTKRKSR